ncbi:MAG TPA: TolC family protein [Pyrinomonadaceae bacterium]
MKSILLVLLLPFAGVVPALAQTPTPSVTPTPAATPTARSVTVSDAVSIFLQQNLQLVASRYDIDTADAEKITARLRPNPEVSIGNSGIPLLFNGPFLQEQTFAYNISQDLELGGKREKRITYAEANAELARANFEVAVWQMTNDVKRKFYTVLLDRSLLDLARENQKTFDEIVDHTRDVFKSGEISGLDFERLEVERLTFDTDVANADRDYQLALRDLRLAIGSDYASMAVDVAGSIEYYKEYDFTYGDLRDKALAARPDLKAAVVAERAADANIILQDAQKIPNLTLSGGVNQVIAGGSNYNFGVGVVLPTSDRNQGERAKARIDKQRALNQEQILNNQILSDVDKALINVNIQKHRVDLYKSGVITKVTNIQNATQEALKAGENSTLDLLDAIRTRRQTLANFYQAIFDYQSALLDLELATATPLP